METAPLSVVAWGAASRAAHDGNVTGDECLVVPRGQGVLIAALDALGHGPEAAAAAAAARGALVASPEMPLLRLLQRCHEALRTTRGIALSIAAFDPPTATLTWLGVGNVEGLLVRAEGPPHAALLLRGGIVGRNLPPTSTESLSVEVGDTLIFATDGIEPGFADDPMPAPSPQRQADRILERHFKGDDDGLVVVVAFGGGAR